MIGMASHFPALASLLGLKSLESADCLFDHLDVRARVSRREDGEEPSRDVGFVVDGFPGAPDAAGGSSRQRDDSRSHEA